MTKNGFNLELAGWSWPSRRLNLLPKPSHTVVYDGQDIAEISLPPICAAANSGVPKLQTNANLTITSQSGCVMYRLNRTAELLSDAASYPVLKGFHNLPAVSIANFQLVRPC